MSETPSQMPFMAHLLELRDRLLRMVLAVLILLLALFPFGNDIFTVLAQPVTDALPEGSSMLATQVLSPFLTPLKLAFVASVFLAMPYLLYQLWSFIAPGLYQHEKRLAIPMLASSVLLFYLGVAFAYFVVLPLLFPFLVGVVPDNVQVAPDIANFLDVAIKLFFAFGLAFEVPIATILLVVAGMTTPDKLAHKRPYIIVGAFVIGMLLTPPDVISQTLLAIPVWLLFELGLVFSRIFLKRREARRKAQEAEGDDVVAEQPVSNARTPAATTGAGTGAAAAAGSENVAGEAMYEGEGDDDPDWTPVKVEVPEDYRPLSEEEMEAELDALDAEDDEDDEDEEESGKEDALEKDSKDKDSKEKDSKEKDSLTSEGTSGWQQDDEDDFFDTIVDKPEDEDAANDAASDEPADAEAAQDKPKPHEPDEVDAKLERVMELRNQERYDEARTVLYEVLVEGNASQVIVARNILSQLDS